MTSASNALADRLCPGRHYAQRGAPESKESKDASTGTLVHKAFCGLTVELNRAQRKTLNRGRYLEFEMVRRFFNEPLPDEEIMKMAHREQRLWHHRRGVPVHSGQLDAFWISRDWEHALIEDLKALFGDVQDATENEQLRDEAAIFWENFPEVKSVSVVINQPNVRWKVEEQKIVTYSLEDLVRAHTEMAQRVASSNAITANRVPGLEQCRYCRAAGTARCPESQKRLTEGMAVGFNAEAATPVQRGQWISELKSHEATVKKLLAFSKGALTADKAWAAGWQISEGKQLREIAKPIEVWRRVLEYFDADGPQLAEEMLHECAKISVPGLVEWFVDTASKKGSTEAEAAQTFKLLFEDLIAKKTSEGSLAKVNAK